MLAYKLYRLFGIRSLMLEGGGKTDSLFLKESLIDEISLVVAPVVDGGEGIDLFDEKSGGLLSFHSVTSKPLMHGGIHLVFQKASYEKQFNLRS